MKEFMVLATAAMALSGAQPARADETAKAANQLLAAQAADAVSTRILLDEPETFERDPLARPFTKSNLGEVAGVIAASALARVVFKRSPKALRWFAIGEGAFVVNNARVIIHAEGGR